MQQHRAAAKFLGRFDGKDRVSQARETHRVAAGARADIEHPAWNRRDQVDHGTMLVGKRDALIALEQLWCLFGIVLGAGDPDHRTAAFWHSSKSRESRFGRISRWTG